MKLWFLKPFSGLFLLLASGSAHLDVHAQTQRPDPADWKIEIQLGALAFSPDSQKLAIGLYQQRTFKDAQTGQDTLDQDMPALIEIRKITSGELISQLPHHFDDLVASPPQQLMFGQDGRRLAASWFVYEEVTGERGSLEIWDLETEAKLSLDGVCQRPALKLQQLEPDLLVSVHESRQGRFDHFISTVICDFKSGRLKAVLPGISALYRAGNLLMAEGFKAHYDGNELVYTYFLELLDAQSFKSVARFPQVKELVEFPTGAQVRVKLNNGKLALLDLKTRRLLDVSKASVSRTHATDTEYWQATSEDQKTIIQLYKGSDNKPKRSYTLPFSSIKSLISPDQKTLALVQRLQTGYQLSLWRLPELKRLSSWNY